MIGDERLIYNCYLLTDASLDGITSRAEAVSLVQREAARLDELLQLRADSVIYSHLLEKVADDLATRDPPQIVSIAEGLFCIFRASCQM
jgi:hypothetical protein